MSKKRSPKSGAQRKREFDQRQKDAGLKQMQLWVTPAEERELRATLAIIRIRISQEKAK